MSIEFATTPELIAELLKRSDACIIHFETKSHSGLAPGEVHLLRRYKGNATYCLGLCFELQQHIHECQKPSYRPMDLPDPNRPTIDEEDDEDDQN